MVLNQGLVTHDEVADVILNTRDDELNHMLHKAKSHIHETDHLIWKLTAVINYQFSNQLRMNSDSPASRRIFLSQKIKKELVNIARLY